MMLTGQRKTPRDKTGMNFTKDDFIGESFTNELGLNDFILRVNVLATTKVYERRQHDLADRSNVAVSKCISY